MDGGGLLFKKLVSKLSFLAVFLLLLAVIASSPLVQANYLISAVSQSVRLVPIYEVDSPVSALSISFDASWGAENTRKILDILDKYDVKATFFLVNIWLDDYPGMAKEIAERGHEIGLHSVTHPHFTSLSLEQMEQELKDNYNSIKKITGYEAKLFRPPFGDYDNRVIEKAISLGFQPVQWSVDSLDWKDLSAYEIEARVMKDIGPGDIVLFHNNGLHTAEALEPIIQQLSARGLSLLPISDLLLQGDWYIDFNGIQRSK
jgi:polysaccharide deacetylase family sporulation protein PdaB